MTNIITNMYSSYSLKYDGGNWILHQYAVLYIPLTTLIYWNNKMKKKNYHTIRTIPKSNIKIVERGKKDTPNT